MSRYDNYKHLLGRRYVNGKQDCYGLVVNYYKDLFGIELKNFARPDQFWFYKDFDLINNMMFEDRWKSIGLNLRNLQIGDGLVFAIMSESANHLGVYAGNGIFLHHQYQRLSKEDPLTGSWASRLLMVVRHKDVKIEREKLDILTVLPDHVKRTLRIDS